MKKVKMMIVVASTALLASCEVAKTTTTVDEHYSQARVLDVQTKSDIKPVQAELRVNQVRIEDEWIFTAEEVKALGNDLKQIHARAAFKTLQKHEADELVAPLYDVKSNGDGSYTVTVLGYTAKFVNWK